MRHFDEDAALARLLVLPRQVFDRVLQRNQIRKKDRKDLRMAFAVMQSMRAPLRPSDQSKLIIGEHVTRTCETGRELLRIQRVAHKNGADLDFELSGEIVSLYDLYLKHGYGPAHQETLYLYRDDKFNNFTPSALSRRMARFLEREIGIPMTGSNFGTSSVSSI